MKRRIKKFIKSMSVQLMATMLFLTVLPMVILQVFYTSYMIEHIRTNRIELVYDYGKMIADEMLNTGYLDGTSSELIEGEIKQFSGLYDGRIIAMNESYTVRFDTDHLITGKKLVTESAIRAMQGEKLSKYDESNDRVWLTYVISDPETQVNKGMILFFVSCADLTKTYDSIIQIITILIVIASIMLIVLAGFLSRRFTKPFKAMATSINRVSEGHFDEEVALNGYWEVEQITLAFNRMLGRLKALESSRQEFVSNVSHELKTPLTSMKVLADALNAQPDAPVELYREFMKDITEEIDRENTIITDLLSLVKMDKSKSDLNISSISLVELVDAIIKRLKPIAGKRNIELNVIVIQQPIVECDEVKLTLAISNLVENAIKYNVAGGWVQVTIDADSHYFYVTVDDSGVGIPEDCYEKIFERFYRVDQARARETGGTGLGLALTKNIIQMHHGAIKVSGKGEEEGTIFSVRIPLTYERQ